ncbi:acyltransferase family protein [Rubellicoccus peritrichatus]|uniref:DUF5009 domain-containing protein n=1 Tax=Rubellicoccus peritrichatus TaxID=3080537 RepID=A0AAQ3LBV4_9BACT|nr:DUF5009 domain-containing protein [Puniceicoccus sp. CR14]WOO40633.1 DUF5009 domain-containing protein [Puniceicoccus sp. CR14]
MDRKGEFIVTSDKQQSKPSTERLQSLDALRGFDMLWIVGGAQLIRAFAKATEWRVADVMEKQMWHAPWHGFTAYDLIFPLFMFLAGISIPYAITSRLEKDVHTNDVARRIIRRTVLLIIFGAIYNGALSNFENARIASVLGQIGVGYCIAAFSFLYLRKFKPVLLAFLAVSIFVAIAQLLITVPGYGAGVLTPEGSMNAYLDQLLLPGKMYRENYDPQGVLCMVSGAGITLLGVLTAMILRLRTWSGYKKAAIMVGSGLSLILVSLLINPWYPINKEIWTTTFNLLTGGISLILFAAFYLVIDVFRLSRWSIPLCVIGVNAITIYLAARLFSFNKASELLFGGIASLAEGFSAVIIVAGVILLEWLMLFYLYKKKIFLKV